jgi:hypothetical protein
VDRDSGHRPTLHSIDLPVGWHLHRRLGQALDVARDGVKDAPQPLYGLINAPHGASLLA